MKKTFFTMLALVAGAVGFIACNGDDESEENNGQRVYSVKPMTFYASMEGLNGGVSATIDGPDFKWTAGDKISVFDGATENNGDQEFTLDAGAGTTSGTFRGSAAEKAYVYYAIYPYAASSYEKRIVTRWEAEEAAGWLAPRLPQWEKWLAQGNELIIHDTMEGISPENQAIIFAYLKKEPLIIKKGPQRNASNQFEEVVFPANQKATEGSADPKAMLMIAKSDDASTFQFKNICAYVKVTPQFNCHAIALRSTDATKKLAGTVTIDYHGGTPTATVTANGTNEILLTGTITAGKDYYIAVLPEALTSGFTIEFLDRATYYYARTYSETLDLARNKVTDIGTFAIDGPWDIKTPTRGADENDHCWQLVSANPMLKLSDEIAGRDTEGTTDLDAVIKSLGWGDDWVLPSVTDLQPLVDAKAISYSEEDMIVNFSAMGVLKYLGDISIEPLDLQYFWLAETGDYGRRYGLDVWQNVIQLYNSERGFNILFKYVGE